MQTIKQTFLLLMAFISAPRSFFDEQFGKINGRWFVYTTSFFYALVLWGIIAAMAFSGTMPGSELGIQEIDRNILLFLFPLFVVGVLLGMVVSAGLAWFSCLITLDETPLFGELMNLIPFAVLPMIFLAGIPFPFTALVGTIISAAIVYVYLVRHHEAEANQALVASGVYGLISVLLGIL